MVDGSIKYKENEGSIHKVAARIMGSESEAGKTLRYKLRVRVRVTVTVMARVRIRVRATFIFTWMALCSTELPQWSTAPTSAPCSMSTPLGSMERADAHGRLREVRTSRRRSPARPRLRLRSPHLRGPCPRRPRGQLRHGNARTRGDQEHSPHADRRRPLRRSRGGSAARDPFSGALPRA